MGVVFLGSSFVRTLKLLAILCQLLLAVGMVFDHVNRVFVGEHNLASDSYLLRQNNFSQVFQDYRFQIRALICKFSSVSVFMATSGTRRDSKVNRYNLPRKWPIFLLEYSWWGISIIFVTVWIRPIKMCHKFYFSLFRILFLKKTYNVQQ